MATKAQREFKAYVETEARDVYPDKVVCKGDGTVELRKGYFYRHGQTAETWCAKVVAGCPGVAVVDASDYWNPWPRDSYFSAVVDISGWQRPTA